MTFRTKELTCFTLFAFIGLLLVSFIAPGAALTRKKATLDFIDSCLADRGAGYYSHPDGVSADATIDTTIAAITLIDTFDYPVTNETYDEALNVRNFIDNLRNKSDGNYGGFKNAEGAEDSMKATYQALQLLDMFDATSTVNLSRFVNFVLESQDENGGFTANPLANNTADIFNTYYALKILELTENLTKVHLGEVNTFVNSCRMSSNLYGGAPNATTESLVATSFAVSIYQEILTNESSTYLNFGFNNAVQDFVPNNTSPAGGVKDPVISEDPLLSTTYFAVKLQESLEFNLLDESALKNWILDKQVSDGGFVEGSLEEPTASSSLEATYHALMCLYLFNSNTPELDNDVPWLLSQDLLIVVVVTASVLIAVVIITIYVKRKNKIQL